jgi:CopG family nickel-responsive transcriptional regulator
MEVIVLRGESKDVTALADSLLNLKGVKHGKLFLTVPERTISRSRPHRH